MASFTEMRMGITVDTDDYRKLLNLRNFLDYLKEVGVEDWEGYEKAKELYREKHDEEEDE